MRFLSCNHLTAPLELEINEKLSRLSSLLASCQRA
jgi:hypothetical protein